MNQERLKFILNELRMCWVPECTACEGQVKEVLAAFSTKTVKLDEASPPLPYSVLDTPT